MATWYSQLLNLKDYFLGVANFDYRFKIPKTRDKLVDHIHHFYSSWYDSSNRISKKRLVDAIKYFQRKILTRLYTNT